MGRHRVKPRKQRVNQRVNHKTYSEDVGEGHVNLAVAIVHQAVRDALALSGKGPMSEPKVAAGVNKYELLNFFRSEWCGVLIGWTELDAETLIERTGLNELFNS